MNCMNVDESIADKLTDFGKAILSDRYLMSGESYDDLFMRVSSFYADDGAHQKRLHHYMCNLWFMPATPILSNGGTTRGLPISCFLNETSDSLNGIVDLWNENVWLASKGGGVGSYWGNLRSIGEKVRNSGQTSGIIPFIKVQDSLTLAISQGSLRRGSAAVYLPVSHPEIEEFLDLRKPAGGDPSRKALNMHHGISITDDFMEAVKLNADWNLLSPLDKRIISKINARDLWQKILEARIETGEPYILFLDNVNRQLPEVYEKLGMHVKTSNLCSEIMLSTGQDCFDKDRTAVCCLSSVNLEYYDDWCNNELFIEDIMRFLDNVLEDFIAKAPDSIAKARYSAMRERSVGLGAMGFHSYLQKNMLPFKSLQSQMRNKMIFKHIHEKANEASKKLASEKGPCPDAEHCGLNERFSNKTAIAPTASISIIAGNTSPGVEPYAGNAFVQKTLTGSFIVRNKFLEELLAKKSENNDEVWSSISTHEGSVQHLDFLSNEEKDIFKTAYEIDQMMIIQYAADRTPYICQSQSVNLFLPANTHKKELHTLHWTAWKKGVKSLYYCRSKSVQRADKVSHKSEVSKINIPQEDKKYEECFACQ